MIKAITKIFQNLFALRLGRISDYLYATLGVFAIMTFSSITIEIFDMLFGRPEGRLTPESLEPFVETMKGPHDSLFYLVILSVCIIAPITEELFFRGVLWYALEKFLNKNYVLIITSVLFALAHGDLYHIIGVFPIGLYVGWLRLRSNSIFPSILAHMVNNFIVCFYMIN